jgi:hypothetical protein
VKLVLVVGTFSAEFQQGRESIGLTMLFLVVVKNVPDAIACLYNQWRSHHRVEPGQPTRLSFWGKKSTRWLARSLTRSLATT